MARLHAQRPGGANVIGGRAFHPYLAYGYLLRKMEKACAIAYLATAQRTAFANIRLKSGCSKSSTCPSDV